LGTEDLLGGWQLSSTPLFLGASAPCALVYERDEVEQRNEQAKCEFKLEGEPGRLYGNVEAFLQGSGIVQKLREDHGIIQCHGNSCLCDGWTVR
jgi:hypothetical protein